MSEIIQPKDFLSDQPPIRIIGTESECNIQTSSISDSEHYGFINDKAVKAAGHISVSRYLENGYRVYPDMNHLEVATPECLGPTQATAGDRAGLKLLSNIVISSKRKFNGLYRNSGSTIKNIQTTNGYHENFLFPRQIAEDKLLDTAMASHLTSRIWAGAGTVTDQFQLSQKIDGIGGIPISRVRERRTSHGSKPMAMITPANNDVDTTGRNEAWARLENRFADPGFSLTGTFLSLATSSLVLRLIEHSNLVDSQKLIDKSFKGHASTSFKFNRDLTFTKTNVTQDGSYLTATDYQELLATESQKLSETIKLPEDEVEAINLWLYVCDQLRLADLEHGEYAGLLGITDFAPRHRYLMKNFLEEDIHSDNNEVVQVNLDWDRVLPVGRGMSYWDKIGSPYVSKEEVNELVFTPPNTRAAKRGKLLTQPPKPNTVTWSGLAYPNRQMTKLDDPYLSS